MIPDTVILELKDELSNFRGIVSDMDMPVVDIESVLQQVFDALSDESSNIAITNLSNYMAYGEGLFENSELDNGIKERIFYAVKNLTEQIKFTLHINGMYTSSNKLPFEFRKLLNDNITCILCKSTSNT